MTDYSTLIVQGRHFRGKISEFGGPFDLGVKLGEDLALYYDDREPGLFLTEEEVKRRVIGWLALDGVDKAQQKKLEEHYAPAFAAINPAKIGLAHRLNPTVLYCAMRWTYKATPRQLLIRCRVEIRTAFARHGLAKSCLAMPVDWGPHEDTGRLIDASPSVLNYLGVETDAEVFAELLWPFASTDKKP